jgi:hypothetical protein
VALQRGLFFFASSSSGEDHFLSHWAVKRVYWRLRCQKAAVFFCRNGPNKQQKRPKTSKIGVTSMGHTNSLRPETYW